MKLAPVLVFVVLLFATGTASAQLQIFFDEDFSSATGTVSPAGWASSLVLGLPGQGWRYDNPGARTINAPLAAPVAIVDLDVVGPTPVTAHLDSPSFDASGAALVFLEWDHWHQPLASRARVFVFDGFGYNLVYENLFGTAVDESQLLDITAACGGASNAQVRFEFEGNFDWWWMIDNVRCTEPSLLDVGITAVSAPAPGNLLDCDSRSATETVTVEVTNLGTLPLAGGSTVPVEFDVDGMTVASESAPVPAGGLQNGGTFLYTFTATADLSSPVLHTMDFRTTLAGDGRPENDELSGLQLGQDVVVAFPFFEDFDGTVPPGDGTDSTIPPAGWVQDPNDNTEVHPDWYFRSVATPSSNTGPPSDHTTGVPGAGYFAYVEDSNGSEAAAVVLCTPCLDLSAINDPVLRFWMHSNNNSATSTVNENFLSVDVTSYPGGAVVNDFIRPIGHLGQTWVSMGASLAPFAGQIVRICFRGRSDGGSFTHDIAIDDVSVFETIPGPGQAPLPGIATLDINEARDGLNDLPVSLGVKGPYFTSVPASATMRVLIEGEARQDVVLLVSPFLNPAVAAVPPFGLVDIGNAGFTDITVVGSGLDSTLVGQFFETSDAGVFDWSFGIPSFLANTDLSFQAIVYHPTLLLRLTNAVEVSIGPLSAVGP